MVICGADPTVSVALSVTVPLPAVVHISTLVWLSVRLASTIEPLVSSSVPSSVQPVTLVELQLKVDVPPYSTVEGFQLMLAVGTRSTSTLAGPATGRVLNISR